MGNGRNIKVWEDNRVPSSSTHKIISPRDSFPLNSRVSYLIDAEQKCWNLNLLNRFFLPFEAEEIASIPLSIRLPDDKQVWAATPNGLFSVRSAYKLALELEKDEVAGSSSDGSHLRRFWKRLWSCQIPHKIRHFAWTAARDILPTKANLVARKILVDGNCEECGLCAKSFYLLFWECQKLETLALIHLFSVLYQRFLLGAFFIFYGISSWKQIGVWKILVALWYNKNEVIHGKPRKAGLKLVDWCKNYLAEYWSANRTSVNPPAHLEVALSPSNFPSHKVNVDAARFMA